MSPTVVRIGKFRVMIYVDDHPPAHVHVKSAEKRAKIGLKPVEVLDNDGFTPHEIGQILKIVKEHLAELLVKWDEYHPEQE